MAKTKVSEFDATASNNTDINSVNISEGCPPSGINNSIREMASLLKKQEVGTDPMTSPDINGGTIDGATIGATTASTGAFTTISASGNVDLNGTLAIAGNTTLETGADLITATAGTSNFRAGVNAGNSITSGGNYNTVVGDEAGTAITTGDNNTLIGYVAGDALTEGGNNTAVGFNALSSDTLGSRNTAIGYNTLLVQNFTSATNSYNVAIGHDAGREITTGINNTLIGGLCGDALTDADNNVALGNSALGADTLGSRSTALGRSALASQNFTSATNTYNVAVGYNAGSAVSTGVENTIIGGLAGDSLTLGNENTAVGLASLGADTKGKKSVSVGWGTLTNQNFTSATDAYNTAVGYASGNDITTGQRNTLIGGLAGDALTDADYNIALGYETLSSDTKGSGSVAIGYKTLSTQNLTSSTTTYNTAVGYLAGQLLTAGTLNTLIGANAGDAITNNGLNTLVGQDAGGALDSPYNTCVGQQSGSLITSGQKNTIIGRYNGNSSGLDIRTSSNNIVLSDGDGNPRMHFNSDGDIGIGTPATGVKLTVKQTTGNQVISSLEHDAGSNPYGIFMNFSGSAPDNNTNYYLKCNDSSGTTRLVIYSDGDIQNHDNSYGAVSDEKLKEQITDASSQWNDIKALTVRKFKMKDDVATGDSDAHWRLGVIAQEVETAGMSGLVRDNPDLDNDNEDLGTTTKSVKYSILYMKAVKALQEAMTRIEALEAKVATLEGE